MNQLSCAWDQKMFPQRYETPWRNQFTHIFGSNEYILNMNQSLNCWTWYCVITENFLSLKTTPFLSQYSTSVCWWEEPGPRPGPGQHCLVPGGWAGPGAPPTGSCLSGSCQTSPLPALPLSWPPQGWPTSPPSESAEGNRGMSQSEYQTHCFKRAHTTERDAHTHTWLMVSRETSSSVSFDLQKVMMP